MTALAGAALPIAIIFGGTDEYSYFGAPRGLVEMARTGNLRAPISCVIIAAFLMALTCYAFSGAGVLRRLPLLRLGLGAIAALLILRGLLFIPLLVWRPTALSGICDCQSVVAFIIATSALCLAMDLGFACADFSGPHQALKPTVAT